MHSCLKRTKIRNSIEHSDLSRINDGGLIHNKPKYQKGAILRRRIRKIREKEIVWDSRTSLLGVGNNLSSHRWSWTLVKVSVTTDLDGVGIRGISWSRVAVVAGSLNVRSQNRTKTSFEGKHHPSSRRRVYTVIKGDRSEETLER